MTRRTPTRLVPAPPRQPGRVRAARFFFPASDGERGAASSVRLDRCALQLGWTEAVQPSPAINRVGALGRLHRADARTLNRAHKQTSGAVAVVVNMLGQVGVLTYAYVTCAGPMCVSHSGTRGPGHATAPGGRETRRRLLEHLYVLPPLSSSCARKLWCRPRVRAGVPTKEGRV